MISSFSLAKHYRTACFWPWSSLAVHRLAIFWLGPICYLYYGSSTSTSQRPSHIPDCHVACDATFSYPPRYFSSQRSLPLQLGAPQGRISQPDSTPAHFSWLLPTPRDPRCMRLYEAKVTEQTKVGTVLLCAATAAIVAVVGAICCWSNSFLVHSLNCGREIPLRVRASASICW